ncbi:hypothetical protein PBI_DEWDROP_146 [Microbacterium phage Dewdrop]|nr:hypothetical protein PBI_LEAF_146 [Microbacterium phage Leaf]QGZ17514.1 hypothetical protein PBI_DEWDROP_146 [Microbacterium phage Dewdrop]
MGKEYKALDANGDTLGTVTGDLRELMNDVPAWENDLQRTLRQIVDDNEGYIEDLDGNVVYDGEEVYS